ncbi:MAG: glycine cleavage system aminomethyltransferase GcvT [Sandaracinaceae bacterium]
MAEPLDRTPLFEEHRALGGRMVPFAGYELPVQYSGVVAEHRAVRTAAGVFDVSHMGRLRLTGPEALRVIDGLVTNAAGRLKVGRAQYTVACDAEGGILDDLIVYRIAEDDVLVIVNASNHAKMLDVVASAAKGRCELVDRTKETALLALQGPSAIDVAVAAGGPQDLPSLRRFGVRTTRIGGQEVTLARTGYTGEDGLELMCDAREAPALWRRLIAVGEGRGLVPAGLGARDTLRLEAALCLYGNDIDESTNPFEAGLEWVVKLDRGDFVGRDALARIAERGPQRRLVGIAMRARGIARHGYPILDGGRPIGQVTSGSPGPTVGENIALGYVPTALSSVGTPLTVEVRNKGVPAEVVATPFYRRPQPDPS